MHSGEVFIKGINGPIRVRRDQFSVPYIEAENENDAWFGLGFVQGQDRAFQLEYYKRQANGSLSEIFGERFLDADRYMRIIGLKRTAEKYVSLQDQHQSDTLTSFTNGINAGIFDSGSKMDEAFEILGCEPTSYEISDVISTQLYFSLSLTHWLGKLTRFLILENENPETVYRLDPPYSAENFLIKPVGTKAGPSDRQLYDELVEAKKILNTKGASNNWVLAGGRTESGHALVANDPHLAADVPAPWYLASVQGPDFRICGACYPGSTFFFNGHNGNVAWAMTAAFIDNVDLYQEKLNKAGDATLADGEFVPCEKINEKILIKGKPSLTEEVLVSRHGPILSPAIQCGDHVISMCATWFKPKPINGFMRIHNAKDVHDVRSIFRDWSFTSTNLVMADTSGNICWQLCGEIPDRKKTKGMLPMPGWDTSYDWNDEIIPYEKNPMVLNPKEEFIATANNK
ncbi:MAG TPA: penicillin acylase family protein, partial [Desulfobacteraceae bacterium]|nr:penicillin acylase family protein [Desulfobacteraceae bacterium]